ncbi:MAG: aminoacyl-histidine dipeptidase [Gemmatimonadota bacterium]
MTFVSELEPPVVWAHFDEILTIPRGSKNEGRMREYVIGVAERHGLEHREDAAGNVVVRKPGAPGHEDAPIVVLQAHLDMVNEKNSDIEHDFDRDPIQPRLADGYLRAEGTTLGSDNGIGIAAMLAILEDEETAHGPLELLFTIDEETGLTGASELGADMLEGRLLLNLDSEDEGELTIGCAGGMNTHVSLPLREEAGADGVGYEIRVAGLKGGHSGVDIHLQRGNAIKLLARALYAVSRELPFHLVRLEGGNAHNAIPREASATVLVPGDGGSNGFASRLEVELESIREELRTVDPGMTGEIGDASVSGGASDAATTGRALELITALPHGVMAMSDDIPGLVETSTNLAVVGRAGDRMEILLSSRSSIASALLALRQRIGATAALAGAAAEEEGGYPAWQPDVSSRLLSIVKPLYAEIVREPKVGGVHAGLECGIIGEKYEGMDMISFGPQIEFPHSPDERVRIDSVGTFYVVLRAVLERLA